MSSCSAIIVNYNTGELLKRVVDRALSCDSINEIIVVDNDSKDNSMSLLAEHEKLKTFYKKSNEGFAKGCNYGAKLAKSDYLLFLNPDCLLTKNTLRPLINTLKSQNNAAIIGCRVNNPDGSEQRATRRRLPTFWRTFKTVTKIESLAKFCTCFAGINLNHCEMPSTLQKVEAISGAFILMKTPIFHQLKGFDEVYCLHFEDLDLFKRTLIAGYQILFEPTISVVHFQGTSSQSNPNVGKLKIQGLKRYFHQHQSKLASIIINAFLK